MEGLQECIVTFIDLVGIKDLAESGRGSAHMVRMHQQVKAEVKGGFLPAHSNVYLWNDSILLLAYIGAEVSRNIQKNRIMREADCLRKKLDQEGGFRSFGIAVQGMAFPRNEPSEPALIPTHATNNTDLTILKASSWAFANCFEIDKSLKQYRAAWYIDSRISKMIRPDEAIYRTEEVRLLPKRQKRAISMYKSYLWIG